MAAATKSKSNTLPPPHAREDIWYINQYESFVQDVLDGTVLSCQKIKKLCQRHQRDLKRKDIFFDHKEAVKHLRFISLIPLVAGEWAGKDVQLEKWQSFLIASIYGWKWTDKSPLDPDGKSLAGKRKHTKVYLQVAKKNSKTTTSALLAIDNTVNDKVPGAQVYFAGYSADTAELCFQPAKQMIMALNAKSKAFASTTKVWSQSIEFLDTGSFIKKVSSDAKNVEGKGGKCIVVDEIHTHPNASLIENLRSGMALYDDPLEINITTAGTDKMEPCPAYPLYEHCANVLDGIVEDDKLFPMIFEIDEDQDDWNDESCWVKANPNIGISPKWSFIRSQYIDAKNLGGRHEVNFKIKHLNLWVDADTVWISDDVYMANQMNYPSRLPSTAYGGLDLASTSDFCCVAFNHPEPITLDIESIDEHGDTYRSTKETTRKWMVYKFYLPEDTIRTHKNEQVRTWAKAGIITSTPGRTTDYNYISDDIEAYCNKYSVPIIFYDKYNANQLVTNLIDKGINMQEMSQTAAHMNVPTNNMEASIKDGCLQHGNNPVMRWMMRHVRVIEDNNKNVKIVKGKSKGAVDGPVATVMSIGAEIDGGSLYDMPGYGSFEIKR